MKAIQKPMKTYTESHYGDYRETDESNAIRGCGASCGGGSEVIVLESNQNHATAKDTEICSTLPASMGLGGGYVPMIVDTLVFDEGQITCPTNGPNPHWNGQCHALSGNAGRTVAITREKDMSYQKVTGTGELISSIYGEEIAQTLDASYYKGPGARNGKEREVLAIGGDAMNSVVRRLTPLE